MGVSCFRGKRNFRWWIAWKYKGNKKSFFKIDTFPSIFWYNLNKLFEKHTQYLYHRILYSYKILQTFLFDYLNRIIIFSHDTVKTNLLHENLLSFIFASNKIFKVLRSVDTMKNLNSSAETRFACVFRNLSIF